MQKERKRLNYAKRSKDKDFHMMLVVFATPHTPTLCKARRAELPVLLPDMPQPLEPEPRDSAAADTPLPEEAEPVPEQASSCSKMSSRTLDMESSSLFWASIGDSAWWEGEKIKFKKPKHQKSKLFITKRKLLVINPFHFIF